METRVIVTESLHDRGDKNDKRMLPSRARLIADNRDEDIE